MQIYLLDNIDQLNELNNKFNNYALNKLESYLIIDLIKQDYKIEWTFNLNNKDDEIRLNFFSLNQNQYKKNIKLNSIHQSEKTYSYVKFHGINFQKSFTNLILESKNNIRPLADIYSEQVIKAIVMDEAKFSGIPKIDAANNSFTSSHKLAVGSLNKEELFYLNSLGINKIDSINIILQSLYKSLMINNNDEQMLNKIWMEIENASLKRL